MNQKHQLIYNYVQAVKTQDTYEHTVGVALRCLGSENEISTLAGPLRDCLADFLMNLAGPELFEWTMWYIYETNYGQTSAEFMVGADLYNAKGMTFYRFLELVDAKVS